MGRKPNQLILEFFERGQKLEDASNRYQHTCKACGEKFPKGRIDSLTTHLVKKCPAIALRDRQRALLQLHELPDFADAPESAKEAAKENGQKGKSVELPYAPSRNWTALETLAEVSRQIDLSEKKDSPSRESDSEARNDKDSHNEKSPSEERWSQSQQGSVSGPASQQEHNYPPPPGSNGSNSALPPIQFFGNIISSPSQQSPHLPGLSLPASAEATAALAGQPHPSNLSLAMSATEELQSMMPSASMTMEPGLGVSNAGISDKFFHPQTLRASSTWPMVQQPGSGDSFYLDGSRDPALLEAMATRAATFPRPIAINPNTPHREYTSEFHASSRPPRPKVRGRFSASRRKEVQEVRKRGACIRCRMLKKPCSGESPCSTCINVESARLWKQPCIRTRIADELELYSASLYYTIAYHEVNAAKGKRKYQPYPGRVEATHFLDSSLFVTFSALESPAELPQSDATGDAPQSQQLLLDWEADELHPKLEQYLKKMAPYFYERETSAFMKPTLNLASELATQKNDTLLPRVLELWTATHVIVDGEISWKTFANPNLPPSTCPTEFPSSLPASTTTTNNGSFPIDENTDAESYSLLCSQLRSGAEKRAVQLSKTAMNDLERRLLQRQQSGWFETFLAAIILLNCVERMSWLFRTWGDDVQTQDQAKWPLDRKPPYYYSQGERFADILHMLLKMRGLPPKTRLRQEDGVIAVVEGGDEIASRYLETVRLSGKYLEDRQSAAFDLHDSRSLELKLCVKLLLPNT
ncbi:hypothetical protein L228DRAFT_211087 [Xylona heveae TC161]|uniref:Zn(2)-C6 fungal-type domain-containing protein n=1 Tax=Xylona heveae (strain CBS 132557 / TC161) TaxID=1328760 RepID=A0A165GKC7_XYLHT|nr:hypothetical protein L228DRAFT_211087 [Xylona heveae TC161]KZF22296.1 hypothetical protein L228DRAFT_211087 [Xylona heveae TC161]